MRKVSFSLQGNLTKLGGNIWSGPGLGEAWVALNLEEHEPSQDPRASPGWVCVSLAEPGLSWGSAWWAEEDFLTPGLCPPHPVTLTMQPYSSSSISFTFRQYDCGTGEARRSEWLHLLDGRPDVPGLPHAALPLGRARPPGPCGPLAGMG